MKKGNLIWIFLLQLCFLAAGAQEFNKQKMDSLLNAIGSNNKSMGTLVIAVNDTLVYSKSIGYAFISDKIKKALDHTTRYRIGSITKMFTAVMAFQLMEEGKLKLTDTLAKYFPQLPNADKITIAHLLSHRSGLYNYTTDWDTFRFTRQTNNDMLNIIGSKKPMAEPGVTTSYSNSNYVLLGYIMEKICKKSYADLLQQRIASRISIKNTYYGGKINPAHKEAFSYLFKQGTWQQQRETDMSVANGAGAIVSTPADLSKFIAALFAGKLISEGSLKQMLTITDSEGYGIEQLPFYDKQLYGHSGQIDLFQSWLLYFPGNKVAVAYISNGYGGVAINDILKGILHIYFNKPYEIPNFKTVELKPGELAPYLGTYACTTPPMKVVITNQGTALFAQATGQPAFPLEAIEKNKFQFTQAGIVIEFFADRKEFTLYQGGASYIFKKTTGD